MKCIIVDDEAIAISILKQVTSKIPEINIIGEFSNALQAIKFLNKNAVDLIFLDIHMPDFDGFDFIQTLKNLPKIVLTTSDRNFALEAFEYKFVVDYLVKPLELDRLKKTIDKVNTFVLANEVTPKEIPSKTEESENNTLYVNIDRRLVKIEIPTISIIEARGDYIKVKTDTKNYIVHSPLKRIEEKLPKDKFLKIHRSFVINIDKIVDIEDNSVLINKDVIPVSKPNRNELRKRLNLL